MDQTRQVLNKRVNEMGTSEATVSLEGKKRIRVELPGVEDADEAIEKVGQTAKLSFLLSDGTKIQIANTVDIRLSLSSHQKEQRNLQQPHLRQHQEALSHLIRMFRTMQS